MLRLPLRKIVQSITHILEPISLIPVEKLMLSQAAQPFHLQPAHFTLKRTDIAVYKIVLFELVSMIASIITAFVRTFEWFLFSVFLPDMPH